jgi:hypothetical protein
MSVDYDDPSLDRLLIEHARRSRAEFTAPGLDGMLTTVLDAGRPRRRWVWPAVAAVLLLAIPLVTVLLVRHGRTAEQPAQPAHPASNSNLVRIGPFPWRDPVWSGKSIWFTAWVPRSQFCKGVASIHADVTEDGAASVTIVASLYINPDRAAMTEAQKEMCRNSNPVGEVGIDGSVDLPEPWDGRSAVDGTAHLAYKVLDARLVRSIPGLPPTFHDLAYSGETDQNAVSHEWETADLHDGITLTAVLADSPLGSRYLHQGTPSTIGLVNGQQTRLDPGDHLVIWQKGAHVYLIQEVSAGGDYHRFSPEQLLQLARGVR